MNKINYLIGTAALMSMFSAYSVSAADINITEAHFTQNGEPVHTLSNGELECVIRAGGAGADAVMVNAIYAKDSNKLIGMEYTKASNGEFSNTVNITDAQNTYVTMFIWDGIESANAKSQVYGIASTDPAPENPWNVKLDNKGGISFAWGASEDNLKTAGYKIYKNGEQIGETEKKSFTDADAKWYDPQAAEYKLTAYDEYGNESDGLILRDVKIDNSDIAAVLFSQPNVTEKMSLYIATGKESDPSWYGYNTSDELDGTECRKIPADRRAVFKLSPDFTERIGEGGRDAVISVSYYDNSTDAFKISYVSTSARYSNLEVKKTGTNTWMTKEFAVKDFAPYYMDPVQGQKVQDESVNFTIWSKADSDKGDIADTETYISEIKLTLNGEMAEQPTEGPTLEPGVTPSPTPEPTAEPTPTPTIDPNTITGASIRFLDGQTIDTCSESDNNLIHIFWAGKNNDEQIDKSGWYGYNYGAEINGEKCRVLEDNKRLVLVYDNVLNAAIGDQPRNAVIRVKYLDKGTDKIRASYIGKNNRYTNLSIQKTDSGDWKWAEFNVTDLVKESEVKDSNNGGYQDGRIKDPAAIFPDGPNFSIYARGDGEGNSNPSATEYIAAVEINWSDVTVPTTAPTDVPTDEPTPTIPAETEAPITSAEIKLLAGNDTAAGSYESRHMSVYWGKNDGQIGKDGWYAYTTGEIKDGEECRVIADNKRIVLMYDEALNAAIGAEPRNAVIRIRYYDEGTDKIRVSYIGETARYKTVTIQKENTNTWKWAEFNVTDLINKAQDGHDTGLQDENTYFSIWSRASGENEENNTVDYISAVELILAEDQTDEAE